MTPWCRWSGLVPGGGVGAGGREPTWAGESPLMAFPMVAWLPRRCRLPSPVSHPFLQVGVWGSSGSSVPLTSDPLSPHPRLGSPPKAFAVIRSLASGVDGAQWAPGWRKCGGLWEALPWQRKCLPGGAELVPAGGRRQGVTAPCPLVCMRVRVCACVDERVCMPVCMLYMCECACMRVLLVCFKGTFGGAPLGSYLLIK